MFLGIIVRTEQRRAMSSVPTGAWHQQRLPMFALVVRKNKNPALDQAETSP